jgi:type IV pilus biogenesis protein CpaD/CtpE
MTKRNIPLVVLLAATLLLSACGKKQEMPQAESSLQTAKPSSTNHSDGSTDLQQMVARTWQHSMTLEVEQAQLQNRWLAIREGCLEQGCLLIEAKYQRFNLYNGQAHIIARLPHDKVEPYLAFLRQKGTLVRQSTTREDRMAALDDAATHIAESKDIRKLASASKHAAEKEQMATVAKVQQDEASLATAMLNTQLVSVSLAPAQPSLWSEISAETTDSLRSSLIFLAALLPWLLLGGVIYLLSKLGKRKLQGKVIHHDKPADADTKQDRID